MICCIRTVTNSIMMNSLLEFSMVKRCCLKCSLICLKKKNTQTKNVNAVVESCRGITNMVCVGHVTTNNRNGITIIDKNKSPTDNVLVGDIISSKLFIIVELNQN